MEKCISVLDRDPSVIVCTQRLKSLMSPEIHWMIDELQRCWRPKLIRSHRFRLCGSRMRSQCHLCIQMYGVMRAQALRATKVFAGYFGCDWNTLAELALLGNFMRSPNTFFFTEFIPKHGEPQFIPGGVCRSCSSSTPALIGMGDLLH